MNEITKIGKIMLTETILMEVVEMLFIDLFIIGAILGWVFFPSDERKAKRANRNK